MDRTPDRVSFAYGAKMPGPVKWSSVDFHMSMSTDVLDGETPQKAIARARKIIMAQCERELDEIEKSNSAEDD
jgi:hypothetical protein